MLKTDTQPTQGDVIRAAERLKFEAQIRHGTVNEYGDCLYDEMITEDMKLVSTALLALSSRPAPAAEVTGNDLYYLRSIKRQMDMVKESLCDESAFSLGGVAFADNIDWLDCYIDKLERAEDAAPSPDAGRALMRAAALVRNWDAQKIPTSGRREDVFAEIATAIEKLGE